jgi:hypothetical protein
MTNQEERDLARRLANDSDVFDFDRALELVKWRPAEAERLLRMQEKMERRQEERTRAAARRRQALIEDFF